MYSCMPRNGRGIAKRVDAEGFELAGIKGPHHNFGKDAIAVTVGGDQRLLRFTSLHRDPSLQYE